MFEIRRGEARDLEQVEAIQAASPQAARWNPVTYLQYDFRVAVCGIRVAGFLVARTAGGEAEILNVAVAPEYRRQGVAKRLLASFLEGDFRPVYLEVRASNEDARNLYKYLGFQEVGVREGYYDSPPEAAIVMRFHSC